MRFTSVWSGERHCTWAVVLGESSVGALPMLGREAELASVCFLNFASSDLRMKVLHQNLV